jgi:hypothetical protein
MIGDPAAWTRLRFPFMFFPCQPNGRSLATHVGISVHTVLYLKLISPLFLEGVVDGISKLSRADCASLRWFALVCVDLREWLDDIIYLFICSKPCLPLQCLL